MRPPWWICLLPHGIARGIWRRARAGLVTVPRIVDWWRGQRRRAHVSKETP